MNPKKPLSNSVIWLSAAAICVFQQLFLYAAMLWRGQIPQAERLVRWDSNWYRIILENGYYTVWPPVKWAPEISNIYFFPGFLIPSKAFSILLGGNDTLGLYAAGTLCSVLLWAALLFFARRLALSRRTSALLALSVLAHPAGFFLAVPYTEALFTACLLFFVLKVSVPGVPGTSGTAVAAAAAGFWMSLTRIVGLPLATLALVPPLVAAWFGEKSARRFWTGAALALAAAGGVIAFFIYCQIQFGHWDAYIETHRVTGNEFDWKRIFEFERWRFPYGDPWYHPNRLGKWMMHVFLGMLIVSTPLVISRALALRRARASAESGLPGLTPPAAAGLHLTLLYASWVIFLLPFLSIASDSLWGIMRHTFPGYILAAVNLFALAKARGLRPQTTRTVSIALIAAALGSFALQFFLAARFLSSLWVS